MSEKKIPYKIYLEESEMPKEWYNVRADMKNKPAPLLNPATLQPMTAEELGAVFCEELVAQELWLIKSSADQKPCQWRVIIKFILQSLNKLEKVKHNFVASKLFEALNSVVPNIIIGKLCVKKSECLRWRWLGPVSQEARNLTYLINF